jgi:hypothetical protein
MQELHIYQSLWAMELRSPDQPERSAEENFQMIAEAGFHGACLDPGPEEIEELRPLRELFEKHSLGCMVNAFPDTEDNLQPLLDMSRDFGAGLVNVISGVMPVRPQDAVSVVRRWIDEAQAMGLPLLFETHRDGLLNDLYFTLQMMQLVPEMRLCADLSHFVVDREFRTPLPERDEAYVQTVLQRSDCFQGRIASREQIQVQIEFPQHREWVDIFRSWWKDGMRMWRKRNADDAVLKFLCELGPPPYAITDRNQQELSDRWEEALKIRTWAEQIWKELQAEDDRGGGQ